ncbi:MAG: hypothetical protein MHPSP_002397 [Paramarteilia canceri]
MDQRIVLNEENYLDCTKSSNFVSSIESTPIKNGTDTKRLKLSDSDVDITGPDFTKKFITNLGSDEFIEKIKNSIKLPEGKKPLQPISFLLDRNLEDYDKLLKNLFYNNGEWINALEFNSKSITWNDLDDAKLLKRGSSLSSLMKKYTLKDIGDRFEFLLPFYLKFSSKKN